MTKTKDLMTPPDLDPSRSWTHLDLQTIKLPDFDHSKTPSFIPLRMWRETITKDQDPIPLSCSQRGFLAPSR